VWVLCRLSYAELGADPIESPEAPPKKSRKIAEAELPASGKASTPPVLVQALREQAYEEGRLLSIEDARPPSRERKQARPYACFGDSADGNKVAAE
jgi:hypothetical protein